MWIILVYLAFCFVIGQSKLNRTKIGAVLICLVGVFIMGARSVSFTGDNLAYAEYFNLNSTYTIAESWSKVVSNSEKDPFFYFVGNILSKIGFNYRAWFILIALIFMAGFCLVMYRHSKDYFFSALVLIALDYFYFAMTGLRQALAMGLCFFAIEYAFQKKLIPFLVLVLLASQFHSSALIFLLVYILRYIKTGLKFFFAMGVAVIIALLFPNAISIIVSKIAWDEWLASYSFSATGLTASGFIIQFSIILFCYVLYIAKSKRPKGIQHENILTISEKELTFDQLMMNMLFVGAFIQAFSINIDNIFRMSMYFSIASAWLIPNTIDSQNDMKTKNSLYYIIAALLLFYFLISTSVHYSNLTLFGV